jgi:hypothetical protein
LSEFNAKKSKRTVPLVNLISPWHSIITSATLLVSFIN